MKKQETALTFLEQFLPDGAFEQAAPGGLDYRLAGRGGGTVSGPAGVACPDHGWPDLADPALTAKLGRAAAHRAKMLPRPPVQQ